MQFSSRESEHFGTVGVNQQWGLSNELFVLGDSLILTVLGQVSFMPVLVLAARLCPEVSHVSVTNAHTCQTKRLSVFCVESCLHKVASARIQGLSGLKQD